MRARAMWMLMIASGCDGVSTSPPPPSSPLPEVVAEPVPSAPPVAFATPRHLVEDGVSDADFAREVLYTWTTTEQIEEARATGKLLQRDQRPDGSRAVFDLRLEQREEPMAELLRRDGLRLRRFAWSQPWATVRGWGTGYGGVLVRVKLAPHAIIGRLDHRGWSFVDLQGQEVPEAEVLAQPHRLAAVYHVWRGDEPEADALGDDNRQPFREYVLCNESALARWEVGTPTVAARVARDVKMLESLAGHFATPPAQPQWVEKLVAAWREPPDDLAGRYRAALAISAPLYQPTAANLRALADALRGATKVEAHGDFATVPFSLDSPKPPPPRPPPTVRNGPLCKNWDPSMGCLDKGCFDPSIHTVLPRCKR